MKSPRKSLPRLSRAEAAAGVATFEKSPSYARFPSALELARYLVPGVHLVVVLRDPVDRAYSAFAHHARHGRFAEMATGTLAPRAPKRAVRSVAPTRKRACDVTVFSLPSAAAYVGDCASSRDVTVLRCASSTCGAGKE